MTKQIRLNAFDMNCAGHLSAGLWTHPRDRSHTYKDLEYWIQLCLDYNPKAKSSKKK